MREHSIGVGALLLLLLARAVVIALVLLLLVLFVLLLGFVLLVLLILLLGLAVGHVSGGGYGRWRGGCILGPSSRSEIVWPAKLVELPRCDERLLLLGLGPEAPLARVGVAVHDDALDLGHHAMVAVGHVRGRHLRDAHSDGLTFSGHQDHFLIDLDAVLEAQEAGEHELGAVADGVHRRVLHHAALEVREQELEGLDAVPQVGLILRVVVKVLSVQNVVHCHHVRVLVQDARAVAAQLLHVPAHAKHEAQVHAERADVGARFAGDPEDAEVALRVVLEELALVNGAHAQLALDGRDKRGPLE
mmetsp:Transcript_11307/g.27527  ORF Transcript_11307/g.27527 Transcript_11307/m.27527 type:complete len:303 (+) Transcript_11307:533-1441(+)